ncbi:MAG TPA: amidohydrolase family protein [Methylomirabilota bacterium]|nr:amidohydrolase family protein [Methylomirabilota bacterium]
MAKQGLKVLDSDMHCMEPADLWERYIDPAYKPFAPRGLQEYIADLRLVIDGKTLPRHSSLRLRSRGGEEDPFHKRRERFRPAAERGWDGATQLDAMDTEGIDVAVVYPSRGLFAQAVDDLDPAFAGAIARAYNDWLHDYCKADPVRLLGAAMISPHDVRDAVEEARRAVETLGCRAVFVRPNPVKGRNWHDPYFEPLWAELERLKVPLGFHEGFGPYLPQVGDRFGADLQMVHTACHPMEMMLAVISMIGGGVLERHPTLRVAFLEGNCGWVPFLLWRLDEHYEVTFKRPNSPLTMKPSDYFKRQCFVSVEADEDFVKQVIEAIGDDTIVFSTDWPHGDSKYPHAVEAFMTLPISEKSKQKILWDNCARYYGIPTD